MSIDRLFRRINAFTLQQVKKEQQQEQFVSACYISPAVCEFSAGNFLRKTVEPIEDKVEQFLTNPEKTILLLQADAGMGKSTFLRQYAAKICQSYSKQQPYTVLRIPLPSTVKHFSQAKERLVENFLRQQLKFTLQDIAVLKAQHKGNLILCFDAVDELEGEPVNLYQTNSLDKWNANVVFTCRSQYLALLEEDSSELFAAVGRQGVSQLMQLYLQPFTANDIGRYIDEYAKNSRKIQNKAQFAEKYQQVMRAIPSLGELFATPYVLSLMVETLSDLVLRFSDNSSTKDLVELKYLTRYSIFKRVMHSFFQRELAKYQQDQHRIEITDPHSKQKRLLVGDDFHQHNINLAKCLAEHETDVLDFSLLDQSAESSDEESDSDDSDADVLRSDILNAENAWLKQFVDRNRDNTNKILFAGLMLKQVGLSEYKFKHSSWNDFFLADSIFKHPWISSALGREINLRQPFVQMGKEPTLNYAADFVRKNPDWIAKLIDLIIDTSYKRRELVDAKAPIAAANAITILKLASVNFPQVLIDHYRGYGLASFQGIQIPEADLSGAILERVDFSGADLTGVKLSGALLDGANFSGAVMLDAEFGAMPALPFEHSIQAMTTYSEQRQQAGQIIQIPILLAAGFNIKKPGLLQVTCRNIDQHYDQESPDQKKKEQFLLLKIHTFSNIAHSLPEVRILKVKPGKEKSETDIFALVVSEQGNDTLMMGSLEKKGKIYKVKLSALMRDRTSGFELLDFEFSLNSATPLIYLLYRRSIKTKKMARGVYGERGVVKINYKKPPAQGELVLDKVNFWKIDESYHPAKFVVLADDRYFVIEDMSEEHKIIYWDVCQRKEITQQNSWNKINLEYSTYRETNPLLGRFLLFPCDDRGFYLAGSGHNLTLSSLSSPDVMTCFSDRYLGKDPESVSFSYSSPFLFYAHRSDSHLEAVNFYDIVNPRKKAESNTQIQDVYQQSHVIDDADGMSPVILSIKGNIRQERTEVPGYYQRIWIKYMTDYSMRMTIVVMGRAFKQREYPLVEFKSYELAEKLQFEVKHNKISKRLGIAHYYTESGLPPSDKRKILAEARSKDIRVCFFKLNGDGLLKEKMEYRIRTIDKPESYMLVPDLSKIYLIYEDQITIYNLSGQERFLYKPDSTIPTQVLAATDCRDSLKRDIIVALKQDSTSYYLQYWNQRSEVSSRVKISNVVRSWYNEENSVYGPVCFNHGQYAAVARISVKQGIHHIYVCDAIEEKSKLITGIPQASQAMMRVIQNSNLQSSFGIFFDPESLDFLIVIQANKIIFVNYNTSKQEKRFREFEIGVSPIISYQVHQSRQQLVINEMGRKGFTLLSWDIVDGEPTLKTNYSTEPYLRSYGTSFRPVLDLKDKNALLLSQRGSDVDVQRRKKWFSEEDDSKSGSEPAASSYLKHEAVTLNTNGTYDAVFAQGKKIEAGKSILSIAYKAEQEFAHHISMIVEQLHTDQQGQWFYSAFMIGVFQRRNHFEVNRSRIFLPSQLQVNSIMIQNRFVPMTYLLELRQEGHFYQAETISDEQKNQLLEMVIQHRKSSQLKYAVIGDALTGRLMRCALSIREQKAMKVYNCVSLTEYYLKKIGSKILAGKTTNKFLPQAASEAYFMQDALPTKPGLIQPQGLRSASEEKLNPFSRKEKKIIKKSPLSCGWRKAARFTSEDLRKEIQEKNKKVPSSLPGFRGRSPK